MFRFLKLRFFFAEVKINSKEFKFDEIKQMCYMLNQQYHSFNEQIDIFDDIKLLDENNKVIGVYRPDDARKKVAQLNKDLVLFNAISKPIICKALSYRHDIVTKFYNDFVSKRKEALIKANTLLKNVKLNPNLTDNELRIKANQIIQLTKKNAQVRVHVQSRRIQDEDHVLLKIESLKNILNGKVKIKEDISQMRNKREQEKDEDESEQEKFYAGADRRRKTWEMVVESLKGEFQSKLTKSVQEKPQESIRKFMRGYDQEQDQDMKQLKYDIKKIKYEDRKAARSLSSKVGQDKNELQQQQKSFQQMMISELDEIRKKQYQLFVDLKLRNRLSEIGIDSK